MDSRALLNFEKEVINMRQSFFRSVLIGSVAIVLIFRAVNVFAYTNDSNVYLPPSYYTFVPPAAGGSYADPVFGTTVNRISDAANTLRADTGGILPGVEAEYSTKSPFNADNSKILLLEFSYFALYDGVTLKRIKPLTPVSASSEPLWSRSDPNIFYFHPNNSNQLKTYNIATDTLTVVHTFSEYGAISGQGESELSYDGDHLVLIGDGHQVFVYTISTDTKGTVFDASGQGTLDSVYITPNNNVLVAWSASGTGRSHGEELYDSNMNFLRQVANSDGHKHITKDLDGGEVLVQTNSADPTPIANCANGIVKINLATAAQTCLLALGNFDKWTDAVHVSAPDQQGWVFVETYNVSAAASPWYPYTNELLQVALDGSFVRRYAQHRSNSSNYDGQPHVSVSRDGSRFTFNSNMMGSTTDVYLVVLSGANVSSGGNTSSNTSTTTSGSGTTPTSSSPASRTTNGSGATSTDGSASATTRTEQDASAVSYSGSWSNNSQSVNSGGSAVLSMDAGSSSTFTFAGTGVRWIGYRDEWSGIASVSLDGQVQASVDTYATPSQARAVLWSATGLAAGSHTLKITVTGSHNASSGGSWVWIDAFDVDGGTSTPAILTVNNQSTQGSVQIADTGIFAAPQGSVAGVQARPANVGEFVTVYCTGLGSVTNPPAPGALASSNPLSTTTTLPQASIGGVSANVSFSGLAPGFTSLYQVNVQVPASIAAGDAVPLVLNVGGNQTNTVTIAVSGS